MELFVLLFDNYRERGPLVVPRVTLRNSLIVVMTKPKEKDGMVKYELHERASRIESLENPRSLMSM